MVRQLPSQCPQNIYNQHRYQTKQTDIYGYHFFRNDLKKYDRDQRYGKCHPYIQPKADSLFIIIKKQKKHNKRDDINPIAKIQVVITKMIKLLPNKTKVYASTCPEHL